MNMKRKIVAWTQNPLVRRKWRNFRRNRRGYWSLWIFLTLFFISLFAEFIANEKPLLVFYKGAPYFPVIREYSETTFGGDFETEADYNDDFLRELIEKEGWMLWPPVKFSHHSINMKLERFPAPPSLENPLGTDDQGRDILARLIYGYRISIIFGLILTAIGSVVGITVGAVQGYYGGWIDLLGQRFMEIWSGLPMLYLLIILSSFVVPNFWWLLGLMLLFSWMSLVGVVRAEFLRCRNLEYVKAAKSLGVGDRQIMFRHILPNAFTASLTLLPFILNGAISTLTSLDFLGFGLPVGSPSLGELLSQGKANLHAPWIGLSAFFLLSIMLSLLVFIGEAVRDAFDPRHTNN